MTLEQLKNNPEFRDFWAMVLRDMEKFRMHEAILDSIYAPKARAGISDELNKQAAIDMWRLEGSLEIWDILRGLLSQKIEEPQELYDGEL